MGHRESAGANFLLQLVQPLYTILAQVCVKIIFLINSIRREINFFSSSNKEIFLKISCSGSEYGPDLGPGIISSSYTNSMRRGTRTLGLQEPDYYHPANTINRYNQRIFSSWASIYHVLLMAMNISFFYIKIELNYLNLFFLRVHIVPIPPNEQEMLVMVYINALVYMQ